VKAECVAPGFSPARVNSTPCRPEGRRYRSESPVSPGEAGEGSQSASNFSLFNPPLEALAKITEQDFQRIFARSPIKRPKYHGWLRNLCVVMGNSGDTRFLPWLERLREHDDPIIREHADWALEQLKAPSTSSKTVKAAQPWNPEFV